MNIFMELTTDIKIAIKKWVHHTSKAKEYEGYIREHIILSGIDTRDKFMEHRKVFEELFYESLGEDAMSVFDETNSFLHARNKSPAQKVCLRTNYANEK